MKKIYEFTPYCDDYDFTLEHGNGYEFCGTVY